MKNLFRKKKQNQQLQKHGIKVVKSYDYRKYNKIIYNVKKRVNKETYADIKAAQKLNIGRKKCRVFDGTDICMCFKCLGYNHKTSECAREETSYRCHGRHQSKECDKKIC